MQVSEGLPHQLMAGPNIANVEAPATTRTAKPAMPPEWLRAVGTQLYAQLALQIHHQEAAGAWSNIP